MLFFIFAIPERLTIFLSSLLSKTMILSTLHFSYRNPQYFIRYFSSNKIASSKFNNYVNSTNFIIDSNAQHLKREKLLEKEIYGKTFIVEKATSEDIPLIIDFYSKYFNRNEVLTDTLDMTKEEAIEIFTVISENSETFVLRDENKFVGMASSERIEMKQYPKEKIESLNVKDYGKLIDSGPFKYRTNNIIHVLLEACEARIYKHLNFPCIYNHTVLGGIHPKYFAQNFGNLLSIEMLKYSKKNGAKYCIGVSTSEASLKLHLKLPGITFVDKFAYENFLYHGRKPLENVVGGNKFAYPFIIDLDEY